MIEVLGADGSLPFAVALAVMLFIAVLEGVATLFGAGLSGLLEGFLPDLDLNLEAPDLNDPGTFTRLLGWLRLGQVPVLMLLVIFLAAFGLIGLGMQATVANLFGTTLPAPVASVPALLLALPVVRGLGGLLGKVMPRDETDAVAEGSFVGRVAVITLGRAAPGHPAQAKLRDSHGQTHYVMVEPDGDDTLEAGTAVLLVSMNGATFRGIRNQSAALVD